VMTMAEAGLLGQESDTMSGVVVPAHTPSPIIELLHREIGKAMENHVSFTPRSRH
jgi:tripartite-type tricarboxylate transporter receptor subunit TctC